MANRPRGANAPPKLAVVDDDYAANGGTDPSLLPIEPPCELTESQRKFWERDIAHNPFLTRRSSLKAFQYCEMAARYVAAPTTFTAAMMTQLDRLSSDLYIDDAAVYRKERTEGGGDTGKKKPTASRFLSKRGE